MNGVYVPRRVCVVVVPTMLLGAVSLVRCAFPLRVVDVGCVFAVFGSVAFSFGDYYWQSVASCAIVASYFFPAVESCVIVLSVLLHALATSFEPVQHVGCLVIGCASEFVQRAR